MSVTVDEPTVMVSREEAIAILWRNRERYRNPRDVIIPINHILEELDPEGATSDSLFELILIAMEFEVMKPRGMQEHLFHSHAHTLCEKSSDSELIERLLKLDIKLGWLEWSKIPLRKLGRKLTNEELWHCVDVAISKLSDASSAEVEGRMMTAEDMMITVYLEFMQEWGEPSEEDRKQLRHKVMNRMCELRKG